MGRLNKYFVLIVFVFGVSRFLWASELVEMKVVDKDYLLLHFKDAEVKFVDDGLGPGAYRGHLSLDPDNSYVVSYGDTLDLTNAAAVGNWTIKSDNDSNYGTSGVSPNAVYRKSRINGMSYTGGDLINGAADFDYTKEHFIYLELPSSMEQGKIYTVAIDANINADTISQPLTFDIFNCPSEAIHTNLVGYISSSRVKAADLYHFMGDGGNRDYSDFVGNEVYIYNVNTEESQCVGSVTFWMTNKTETHHNLTGSDVWNIDFTGFNQEGTYRLAVDGVGCSEDFEIKDDIYHDPFKVSVLGYFYIRISQDNMDMTPVPRRPLYIQGEDPSDCEVFVTDMHPFHPQWNTFSGGDPWDKPADWTAFKKSGSPTNPNAIGGHSDAHDWDRFLNHVVNIYDLCLAYILSDGALDDDDLRIAESGNGIPDILDEARNEVDFWLNLRYNGGYSHGLTNPDDNNKLYQAENTAIAAWANALNSSMLAYCFQIAGLNDLKDTYLNSAIIAYYYADTLADPMLDTQIENIRGIDFKMMAAAYLYNLTGDTAYEDIINSESMVTGSASSIYLKYYYNQLWGTAAYLLTKRTVHYPELYANMKSAIIAKAKGQEANNVKQRPSRRGYSYEQAWFQTNQDMPRTVLAHAVTDNPTDRITFLDALSLEADWGLGRNPLNMIQMTTATTELADKRSVENCYTSGRDDGTPGLHPGHTPYLNTEPEGDQVVNNPQKVLNKFYPDIGSWPHASKYINTRYIWTHSELTPRTNMRGKTLLYAYLYNLSQTGGSITPVLVADAGPDQRIFDEDEDGKEMVQLDGSGSYSSNSEITGYKWSLNEIEIAAGETATVELDTGSYEITLKVEDANEENASDDVKIDIISLSSDQKPEYNFETPDQLDDWIFENWGEGGAPTAVITSEKANSGSYSVELSGNYIVNSQMAFKKPGPLDEYIETIVYYVWIPQAMVDSSKAAAAIDPSKEGGIQNYLIHTGCEWKDIWVSLFDLQGDAWNKISFQIPEDVPNSEINEAGLLCTIMNAGVGESSIYIDDIYFNKTGSPAGINDPNNELVKIPGEFWLFNNFPNPFNSETKIRYNLPKNTKVKMNVYNIAGRRVKTLINDNKNAGSYEIIFDGSELPSGVYLYTLEAGKYKNAKKMILLK